MLNLPLKINAHKFQNIGGSLSNSSLMKTSSPEWPDEAEGIKVDIGGVMGNTPFKISGNLGSLIHGIQPELIWPVHLTIDTANSRLSIDGSIKNLKKMEGMDLNFVFTGQSLDELADMLGINFPSTGPITIKGNFKDKQPLQYELTDLQFIMGKSELKGSCSIDLTGDRPQIAADFFSPRIDYRDLSLINNNLSKQPNHNNLNDTKGQKTSDNTKVFSQEPINLNSLKTFDLKLEFLAEKLLLPRAGLKNFHLKTDIENGAFFIDSLTANIGGGRLLGMLQIEPSHENISVVAFLDIENMELQRMLEDMELKNIEGRGLIEVHLELNSQGKSMADLMAGLTGNAGIIMGNGRIDSTYLDFLGFFKINLISSFMNILNITPGFDRKRDISDTNCFVIRFDILDGLANMTALVLDTHQTTFIGNGKIDLASEKLDVYLKPITKEGIGAEGLIKFNLSLSELTRVLYLSGTLANPVVTIDTTQTFVTLGKAIGGAVLFGPAGIAAALFSGKIGKNSTNPCLEAIEEAQKGVVIEEKKIGIFRSIDNLLRRFNPFN